MEKKPFLRGQDFLVQVCSALNIDPEYVSSITITARVGSAVEVEVHRIGTHELLNIEAFQPKGE